MSTTRVNFVPSKYIEVAQTNQYTSNEIQGSVVRSIIDKCTVANNSSSTATFSLSIPNSGDSTTSENTLIDNYRVEPGTVYDCFEVLGQVLQEGQYISTSAGTGNSLSLRISGREIVI